MTVQEQKRRNKVVLRIRTLQSEKTQQGGLRFEKDTELTKLQIEADKEMYFIW